MKRMLMIIAAAALASCVLAPAATAENASPNPKQVANAFCHEQKKQMKADTGDNQAFKELYNDGKRAMQTCKRENQGEAEVIVENAAQECKTYREEDSEGFTADYGDRKNAFGKCVSDKAKEQSDEEAQNLATAAHECKTYREEDSAGFTADYGDRKNAFGKCVSDKAKEQSDEEAQNLATAAHECKTYREEDSAGFTADYGDRKNAFGKCVSDMAREDEEEPTPTA